MRLDNDVLNRLESVMTKINASLTDPESPMYLKNVKKLPVNENGMVVLDKNNPEHREWADDDIEQEEAQ